MILTYQQQKNESFKKNQLFSYWKNYIPPNKNKTKLRNIIKIRHTDKYKSLNE